MSSSVQLSVHQVLAARRARVVFATALLIAGPSALAAVVSFDLQPLPLLAGAWALALGFGLIAALGPAAVARAAGGRRAPVAPFATRGLEREAREAAAGLRAPSFALPLVAFAVVAPLSLHAVVATAFGGGDEFKAWIAISAILVTHAHIVLAVLAARFARNFLEGRNRHSPVGEGVLATLWAALAAAVPGVVFLALPPVITFFTGMAFVPLAFSLAASRLRREEAALEAS